MQKRLIDFSGGFKRENGLFPGFHLHLSAALIMIQ